MDTRCKQALGIHWGTWVLTEEEVLEPPQILKKALAWKGISEEGVFDRIRRTSHAMIDPVLRGRPPTTAPLMSTGLGACEKISAKMTPIAAMAAAIKPYCMIPDDAASPLKGSTVDDAPDVMLYVIVTE
ncbi:hypothetical protein LTR28_009675 [Elasticomyces elasticus]|nr:hypothetical protein LTR28_009675 [Elasticomyces elasticus]